RERLDHRAADDEAREPLVVGRHGIPRCVLGGRAANRVLVSRHVVAPVLALLGVTGRALPVLVWITEPFEERRGNGKPDLRVTLQRLVNRDLAGKLERLLPP